MCEHQTASKRHRADEPEVNESLSGTAGRRNERRRPSSSSDFLATEAAGAEDEAVSGEENIEGCGQHEPEETTYSSPLSMCCCYSATVPTAVFHQTMSPTAAAWLARGPRHPSQKVQRLGTRRSGSMPYTHSYPFGAAVEDARPWSADFCKPLLLSWIDHLPSQRHPHSLGLTMHVWTRVQSKALEDMSQSPLCMLAGCLWLSLRLLHHPCCCPTAEELPRLLEMPHLRVVEADSKLLEWLDNAPFRGYDPDTDI
eukprot:scaffold90900_cov41-Prasinocladus_malaysianus.AAC.1